MAKPSALDKIISDLKADIVSHERDIVVTQKMIARLEMSRPFRKKPTKPRVVPREEKSAS